MRVVNIAITAASFSGNKGAAAMLQSSLKQLRERFGRHIRIRLMSTYPKADRRLIAESPDKFDNITVVNTSPERLVFLAFPLAVLYSFMRFVPPLKKLLEKNSIIRAYSRTDLVIDEAGVAFVDSRGFVMNTYAFICAAVPMLCGVPVVKYSQALGTFRNPYNRFLAKWILPKMRLICARGEITRENLAGIGVTENVRLCADGAFSMPDSNYYAEKVSKVCEEDSFFTRRIIAVSLSSVVQKKCEKQGKDYKGIMTQFINWLTDRELNVLIIANAARHGSMKPRNNDLMICDEVYGAVRNKSRVRWYHEEMAPEEIREYIGRCELLVASRFHAMIAALERNVPPLLIGWSHKYKEVLDMFGLGGYAVDHSSLSVDGLKAAFLGLMDDSGNARAQIRAALPYVRESSRENIQMIGDIIEEIASKPRKFRLLDYSDPDRYMGEHIACRMGYSTDEKIRANAASGGMVTSLLCSLLESGEIDGAWLTRTEIRDGQLSYKTFIATSTEEIRNCSSSVYMYVPMMEHIEIAERFEGRLAVVMLPCTMRSFTAYMESRPALREKVVLKIGLFCSGAHEKGATLVPLKRKGISLDGAVRLYYRRGHWRGQTSVVYADGTERTMSYGKTVCAYKNAYFFSRKSCMLCTEHFCESADISFGDIWLRRMKKEPIKHSCCVIRTERGMGYLDKAESLGRLKLFPIPDEDVVRGQKRALVFKFCCASEKSRILAKQGKHFDAPGGHPCRWNHRLAARLGWADMEYSEKKAEKLEKIPTWLIYYYMCFIRLLLSF